MAHGVAVPQCHQGMCLSLEHLRHVVWPCHGDTEGHGQAWSILDMKCGHATVPPSDVSEPEASWTHGVAVPQCHQGTHESQIHPGEPPSCPQPLLAARRGAVPGGDREKQDEARLVAVAPVGELLPQPWEMAPTQQRLQGPQNLPGGGSGGGVPTGFQGTASTIMGTSGQRDAGAEGRWDRGTSGDTGVGVVPAPPKLSGSQQPLGQGQDQPQDSQSLSPGQPVPVLSWAAAVPTEHVSVQGVDIG